MPTGQDIVNAAYELKGAPYRPWSPGWPIPMWLNDGQGDPPAASYLLNSGVMCSDLINYALERCGLPPGGGTAAFSDYLVNQEPFDPSSPGQPGAVALAPYHTSDLTCQGHVALYVDEHIVIQALIDEGVTDKYDDETTYGWGEDTAFTVYGFLPGVDYSDAVASPTPTIAAPKWIAINHEGLLVANGKDYCGGWYDTGWQKGDWSFYGPKSA